MKELKRSDEREMLVVSSFTKWLGRAAKRLDFTISRTMQVNIPHAKKSVTNINDKFQRDSFRSGMSTSKNPQVFISYARENHDKVHTLYRDLHRRGVNVWMDTRNLPVGRWKSNIKRAISHSRYFLFCVSKEALKKTRNGTGFVDDELQYAYDISIAQDERNFTIIPIRLEDGVHCDDHRLSGFKQFDLIENWETSVSELAALLGGIPLFPKERELSKEEEEEEKHYRMATAFYFAGFFEKALGYVANTLTINPSSSKAITRLGAILNSCGQNEDALYFYNKVIEKNPDYPFVWNNKGKVLLERFQAGKGTCGTLREALECFNKSLKLMPGNAPAWNNKGNALLDLYQVKGGTFSTLLEALECYNKAIENNPKYCNAWFNKGVALELADQKDDADEAFVLAHALRSGQ